MTPRQMDRLMLTLAALAMGYLVYRAIVPFLAEVIP